MSEFYLQVVLAIVAIVAVIYKLSTFSYKPEQIMAQLAWLILAIVFLFAGLFLIWTGNEQRNLARESVKWPITNGHVIYSKNAHVKCGSEVNYSYTVNGHTYSSWQLAYNIAIDQDNCDVETKYPPGASVKVRYSPSDPSKSCLEIGNTNLLGQYFYMSLGALFGALIFASSQPVNRNTN